MCKFIGKSNERILCKLRKSEILRLYSIVHVAMETTKTSNFTCQSKSFISIFFTCQVSAYELQPFSCHQRSKLIFSISRLLATFIFKMVANGSSLGSPQFLPPEFSKWPLNEFEAAIRRSLCQNCTHVLPCKRNRFIIEFTQKKSLVIFL